MHEASLVQGLLKIVFESLDAYNKAHPQTPAGEVREIVCEAGLLTCVEEETLRACFEIFAEGTVAQKAQLKVKIRPLQCVCQTCGKSFEIVKREFSCPWCESPEIRFKDSSGLVLMSINVASGEKKDD